MAQFGPYDTQWLTRASFEPAAVRRRMLAWGLAGAVLLLAVAAALYGRGGTREATLGARLAAAEQESAVLRADLERTRADLVIERATREEVERQADALGQRVAELNEQIQFLASRRALARND